MMSFTFNIGEARRVYELRDIYVIQGQSAYFYCPLHSEIFPVWTINGSPTIGSLPARHRYSQASQTLEVRDTQLSDNGTTYQCSNFSDSTCVAILTVSQKGQRLIFHEYFCYKHYSYNT